MTFRVFIDRCIHAESSSYFLYGSKKEHLIWASSEYLLIGFSIAAPVGPIGP